MINLSPLRKITLVLISSSLVAISLLVFYLHHALQQSTISQWVENNTHSVRQLAAWIDQDLEHAQMQLRHIAQMPEFQEPLDATLIDPDMHGIPLGVDLDKRQILDWSLLEHDFSVMFLLLPDGRFYLAHPFPVQQKLNTDTLAHRAYLHQANQTKKPVLSDSFVGSDGMPAVAIDIPIISSQEQINGHLGGVFHLASLARFFPKNLSNIADERFLLDRRGQLIAHNADHPEALVTMLNAPTARSFISAALASPADEPYPIVTDYLPGTQDLGKKALILTRLNNGWIIGVSTQVNAVVTHFIPYISRTAGLAALLLMVIGIIGIAFAHKIGERWQAAEQEIRTARNELEIRVLLRTTELGEKEERFRSIFQTSVVGMIIVTHDQNLITEWNQGAERIFGYTQDQAVGQSMTLLMPERYRTDYQAGFKLAIRQSRSKSKVLTHALTGLRQNGEEFPLELTLSAWEKNGVIYYNAIILDVTERKRAEQYVRRSQKMQAIGQLTGGIAHDFNNILSIILGNLSLLKLQIGSDEKIMNRIGTIQNSAQRAVDLTKQLLRFSSNKPANVTVTDLNQVMSDMTNLISGSLTPEVMIELKFAESLWLIEIDAGDFGDALLNLIINARDAMNGRGKLLLETANYALEDPTQAAHLNIPPGDYVRLTVSDTGTGIPRELQERIFEPFFTTKESGKGTGLGLAMVYGFVQRAKGYIRLYSELGIGSSFKLYLPRSRSNQSPPALSRSDAKALPRGTATILVVDDELKLREMAAEMLQTLGYRVLTADDASSALNVLAQRPEIALLFSDIVMPGQMNGYELAATAMASYPKLKVLLTSGYAGKAAFSNSQATTDAVLITKPYSQVELADRVNALLANR